MDSAAGAASIPADMATTAPPLHAEPWPSPLRLGAGLAQPGGPAMVRRALEGVGLEAGDRVVELAPGIGATTAVLLELGPREWTGVEPDPIAAEHLERAFGGPGREVARAPVDATGLGEDSASVLIVEALLSTLEDAEAAAVLEEARRVLRPGGGSRSPSSRRPTARPIPRRRTTSPARASALGPSRRGGPSPRARGSWWWAHWAGASLLPRRVS